MIWAMISDGRRGASEAAMVQTRGSQGICPNVRVFARYQGLWLVSSVYRQDTVRGRDSASLNLDEYVEMSVEGGVVSDMSDGSEIQIRSSRVDPVPPQTSPQLVHPDLRHEQRRDT